MRVQAILAAALLAAPAAADQIDPEQANERLAELAERARSQFEGMTFEEFEAAVPYYPEIGKYVVNGDVPIRNEKLLREFWERNVQNAPQPSEAGSPEFIVIAGGLDQLWNTTERQNLSYCVSTSFGSLYPTMVADMAGAAAAWEAVADLDFVHIASEDGRCDASNQSVMFDVRPINVQGEFLAIAFFPNEPRSARNIFVDASAFALDPNGNLTLRGILRHELGHTLGARHEHTRPEAGACFEDNDWDVVTDYDAFSVMHYPQCNGQGDWTLRLTETDKSGVACIYGAASGFTIDTDICTPMMPAATAQTVRFTGEAVALGESRSFGPFPVEPLSRFVARMTGSGATPGDPDLYVKFEGPALLNDFDCRPFSVGPEETCAVDVPGGSSVASVMVHGFAAGAFDLEVTHVAP